MGEEALLPPLGALLQDRLNATTVSRRGNLDVYSPSALFPNTPEVSLCHVYTNLPFTNSNKESWNNVGTYQSMFALALAAQHLNTGNGSIVEQVADVPATCPSLKFTIELADTELAERIAVNQVIQATNRADGKVDNSSLPIAPCLFLGAARSAVSIPTSIITGLRDYPQLSPISTSTALNDKNQHPLFGRTIPADDGTAVPLVLYFRDILKIKYLAVIHINDSYGSAFGQGLQAAAQVLAPEMTVQAVDIPIEATPENINLAVSFLRQTNYAYFFGILFPTQLLDDVIQEAYRQGIAGTGQHQWFFSDTTGDELVSRMFERDGALAKSYQGAAVISASAGSPEFNPQLAQLTSALQNLRTKPNLDYVSSILPRHDEFPQFTPFDIYSDEFMETPGLIGPFVYDAMIVAGLAACQVHAANNGVVDGTTHFQHIVQQQFDGTSGRVVLDPETATRDASSSSFQLLNHVVDQERTNATHIQYRMVLSDIFLDGAWVELEPFVFNDGTTNVAPGVPPITPEQNHFSAGIRAGGLIMCGLAIGLAVSFMIWTKIHETQRVVRASQPIFLHIICVGSIVFSSAIIPLSIDEGVASVSGCDVACQAVPWLLSIGFSLTFSALFTKTWRINKIFNRASQFKRIKLTVWDVAKPMVILLGLNVVVLSLSTALGPLYWDFAVERRDGFGQVLEGYGFCSGADAFPYLIALGVLNFGALLFAVLQAYNARNISIQYAESDYIFRATLSILMVLFVGVPVLVLARDNSDAYFFVFSAILFLTSICILLLIFVPKIQFLREEKRPSVQAEGWRSQAFKSDRGPAVSGMVQPSSVYDESMLVDDEAHIDGHDEEEEDNGDGLKIITNKSQAELVEETKLLRRQLKAALSGGRGALRLSLPPESMESIPLVDTGSLKASGARRDAPRSSITEQTSDSMPQDNQESKVNDAPLSTSETGHLDLMTPPITMVKEESKLDVDEGLEETAPPLARPLSTAESGQVVDLLTPPMSVVEEESKLNADETAPPLSNSFLERMAVHADTKLDDTTSLSESIKRSRQESTETG